MKNFKLYLILRSSLLPLPALEMALAFSPAARREIGSVSSDARGGDRRIPTTPSAAAWRSPLLARPNDDDDDDDEESNLPDNEEGDWRTFRAKLVMSEGGTGTAASAASSSALMPSASGIGDGTAVIADDLDLDGFGALFSDAKIAGFTPLSPSQWAYDSGKVVERGAVILGGVEQDFGFGLRQQYFHKAVILVLDHDENTFTKGIILNRPSDRMMDDDENEGLKWRVWFGGDVQGLDSLLPDIVCLHSLRSKEARDASVSVMKDIQWTSFANAKKLVKRGIASGPEDFWLFAGYAGWGPRQLSGELDRKSWYMCATDSQTLLKELARQSRGVDPRDAGLETWTLLMDMIGRGETATKHSFGFDDLMLKEWSQANLVKMDGGQIGFTTGAPLIGGAEMSSGTIDKLMMNAAKLALAKEIAAGSILSASSADRSPFLLSKQELHHSLILVLLEDEKVALGCMLNHPSTKGCDVGGRSIPIRYGGDYAIKGESPVMWLHCNEMLLGSGLGTPVGDRSKGIYKCTQEEATAAISRGIANTRDFLVMSGVCVWPKHSLANDVERGVFDVVEPSRVKEVLNALQKQEILTKENLDTSLLAGQAAWQTAASRNESSSDGAKGSDAPLTLGIGEGFDEEDETVVFNSDKKVSELANDALKKWVATFLLGSPTLA